MYYYYRILHFVLMNLKVYIRERKRMKRLYMGKNEGMVGCGRVGEGRG